MSTDYDSTGHDGGTPPLREAGPAAQSLFLALNRTQRPPWEQRLLAAATPVRPGTDAPAVSWGAGGPVLLVHGWRGRGTQLGRFVAPLVRTGHRVIAVDAPGHGDSPVGWFTPVAFADALLRIQEEAGALDGVVAHSLGAAAVTAALRDGLRTASLALIAPIRSFTGMARRVGASLGFPPDTPAGREYLRLVAEVLGRPLADLDLDPDPVRGTRVLLCHDADDRTIPVASTRQLAAEWPHAAFVETAGLGHEEILAAPEVISAVLSHVTAASAASPLRESAGTREGLCPEPRAASPH